MITPTKITLSAQERQLVANSDWILTKHVITGKVYQLLGALSESYKRLLDNEREWLPAMVVNSEPKIYKGENYRQLPYVLLDHPRCFSVTDVFAIRTLFWWGNFFSITLQLSGHCKTMFLLALHKNLPAIQSGPYYICVNDDAWQHHFNVDNYMAAAAAETATLKEMLEDKPFIKLALSFPLDQWDEMPAILERSFFEMLQLLKA